MGDFLDRVGLARVKAKIDTLLAGKLDASLKGASNGVAELDANGKVIASQLPSYTDTTYTITQDLTDGHKITLTGTDGTSTTITIPDNNTTYSNATQSVDGLMSSSDKTSLDDIKTALTVDASTTTPGRVSTGEQEFAGLKTFSSLKSRYTMNVHGTNSANFNVRLSAAPTDSGADGLIGIFSAMYSNLKSWLTMKVFGVNSQGNRINYYDEYRLPETAANKSENNIYNILTTKAVTLDASAQAAARGNIRAVSDADVAIMSDGNIHAAIAPGQAVFVRKHSSLPDGLYWANTAIAKNIILSTSNLTADTSGGLNKLKGDIDSLNSKMINAKVFRKTPVKTLNFSVASDSRHFLIITNLGLTKCMRAIVTCSKSGNVAFSTAESYVGSDITATAGKNNLSVVCAQSGQTFDIIDFAIYGAAMELQ